MWVRQEAIGRKDSRTFDFIRPRRHGEAKRYLQPVIDAKPGPRPGEFYTPATAGVAEIGDPHGGGQVTSSSPENCKRSTVSGRRWESRRTG